MWPTLDEQFGDAEVVFAGEVVQVQKVAPDNCADEEVTFRVLDLWKGDSPVTRMLRVVTSSTGRLADGTKAKDPEQMVCFGGCGAAVDIGERFIVFAYSSEQDEGEGKGLEAVLSFSCVDMVRYDDAEYAEMLSRLNKLGERSPE